MAVGSGFCGSTFYGVGLIHCGHCLNHGRGGLKTFNDSLLCMLGFFVLNTIDFSMLTGSVCLPFSVTYSSNFDV